MSPTIAAPVTAVRILEDRASVTRHGRFSLAAGQHRLVIEGIAPVLADKTLIAVANGARVLDVRCERYLAPWRDPNAASASDVTALKAELRTLELELERARTRMSAARSEIAASHALLAAAQEELAKSASRGIAPSGAAAQLADLDASEAATNIRLIDAERTVDERSQALSRLGDRLRRAQHQAGTESARLVVDVLAQAAGDVHLTIEYVVPGAAWRPYHRAVLAKAAGRVDWTTTACVWQSTGEDWTDVALTFSLERASLGVTPPDLRDDELRARKKPDQVTVEAREQIEQTTGLGGGALEVPGIDDGGLGLVLTAAKATVASNGEPHRIPVSGFTAPTQLSLVAIPLKSPWVHVRARITNTGTPPLLAGPVDLIMSSGYVGRAEVGFVAAGEKFHIGFGPQADVRVHRTETRDRDDAGILGGWNVQTVRVAVRLSNLGTEKRIVEITERVPVSEVEQVEIVVSPSDAYKLDDKTPLVTGRAIDEKGMVTWTVELPPQGQRAVALEYKVRSQRGVAGV
ncbi:DUF4139 domain-containing protein [soil metagenome]